jgi:hypothetical protein
LTKLTKMTAMNNRIPATVSQTRVFVANAKIRNSAVIAGLNQQAQ